MTALDPRGSSGEPPDTLGGLVRSPAGPGPAVVIDDLCADPVDAKALAGHVAAVCARLRAAGVDTGAVIAVRVGQDAASVVALLAAAAYGTAVPVAADAPELPAGPFEIRALVTGVPPAGAGSPADREVVTVDASDLAVLPPGDAAAVPVRAPAEPALLLCTSGTTGDPKWVRLSQRNLVAAGTFIAESLRLTPADRGLSMMPLHHGHGITAGVLAPLLSGGELVIIDSSDLAFLQEGLRGGITWYSAAPTVHASMLVAKRSWPEWFRSFRPRVIRSTSEALPAADRARLEAEFAAPVIEAYALTEVPGHACTQVLGTAAEPGWMPPQAGVEVETVDPDGRPTGPGVPGRIRVRGPNVMLGYVGHEPVAPGGWYPTSDIGVRRPDGPVSVLGRDSEAIKRGGETIAPAVVESLVEKHPDIERARACGVPHASLGEQICVAVISGRGAAAAGELLRDLRTMLPANLTPSRLRVVDAFPGSPGGKVRRSDLRPLFAE
ncbi:AMP-binding protein [Actinomadura latina]|uniref:AMP-binding protein n=1 Tax=Actinomadura latina TaxID=163603 RepID=A0A846Z4L9_9ACTN|nr:AMP-binding protein [Actinomadura latina]NKZ08310.1 AMP-binding protein [Actinomadura latina]